MRSVFFRSVIFALLLAVCVGTLTAQTNGHVPVGGERFNGEVLKYDGKLNKILRGISIAELSFETSIVPGTNNLVIKSEAVSKGTLLKLFRFSFLQQYESTVDIPSFRIVRTGKHDVQKQRVRDSEALFDYNQKMVTFVETDPVEPTRPPRRIASAIGDQMYDMITAIYAARLMPLSIGKRFDFSVSDSGLVYRVPIVVTGREQQKTIFGKIWCYRVEPEIFGKDRLIEQKGKMVVWLSDDGRRIPVKSQIHTGYGRIDIKLKSSNSMPQASK